MRHYIFLLLILFACKKNDRFKDEQLSPVNVAISSENGIVNIPGSDNYTKATDDITIPVKLVFSAAAPKIFTVNIGVDNDTVNTLINHQQLGDAVLLDESYYTLPRSAEIRFGLDTFSVPVKVSMQAIERYYGHDLALAVRLSDATKGNTLDASGQMAIILIHTDKVIAASEIHYLYFTKAGSVLLEPDGTDHTLGNTEVTLPVSVTLGGTAGGAFSINLSAAPDTAQALIDNGTLPGSVLLASGTDYTLPATVNFPANTNVAKFNLTVKTASITNNVNNKPVLAIQLSDPTRHLLDSSKSVIVLELDPSKLIETDITNQNIKYTTQYDNGNANENSPKLIDNNINTKFLLGSFSTVWAMLEFDTPQTTGAYTMTSANDAPDRDPKDWTIEGSNNGTDWVVVDKRVNQNFGSRFLTVKYSFSNQDAYKFYRLYVTATNGSSLWQQAEWRLIKRP
ncbi:DUF1735 domain-containing protein [Chitinophaga sancti]|uniref:BT_3987 domain-containing protein n=1 Tax=Chitinophaga sancti TaxID=1004 RepID=UPI002A747E25|nr:DUF1735 domain-containing protein [Chitinophaga sancti]WPQ65237.1 DUF1735 domain-containing protein [Chitinophaga sancti]